MGTLSRLWLAAVVLGAGCRSQDADRPEHVVQPAPVAPAAPAAEPARPLAAEPEPPAAPTPNATQKTVAAPSEKPQPAAPPNAAKPRAAKPESTPSRPPAKPAAPAPDPSPPPPAPIAAPTPAKPATKVVIPSTERVRVEVPPGLQAWLDKDTRMQPWLGKVMKVIDACYADVLASNPGASGTISFRVTMHENARPDPDIQALPGQLSGVVACATGQLMRTRMPLFTGTEGEQYVVRVKFGN